MSDGRRRPPAPEPFTPAEWATLLVLCASGIILAAWLVTWAADRGRAMERGHAERTSPPASLLDDAGEVAE